MRADGPCYFKVGPSNLNGNRYIYSIAKTDLDFDVSLDLDLYFGGQKIKIGLTQSIFKVGP